MLGFARCHDSRKLLVSACTCHCPGRGSGTNGLDNGRYRLLIRRSFLLSVDKILPHLHSGLAPSQAEGIKTTWQRSTLLVLAITLHNIPEGLAVGVAFGAAASGELGGGTLAGAMALALGIGFKIFRKERRSLFPCAERDLAVTKAFFYGQISGDC
jgi:Predicted divalent heavy-metal cations transporter